MLLERVAKGAITPEMAFEAGSEHWRDARSGGDFRKNLESGQEQAALFRDAFEAKLAQWVVPKAGVELQP